ncbi:hypothetical protein GCM10008937_28560 [Deinococcus depolymerans]|uniref:Uncharacterized protein n=1 Tax=Deinococcus depolymerans TaxID=392408 RepID=A0ABP3MHF9_9DEIO
MGDETGLVGLQTRDSRSAASTSFRSPATSFPDQSSYPGRPVSPRSEGLGWPGAVGHTADLVTLSREPRWTVNVPQNVSRLDDFCEGSLDPWITEYRSDTIMRSLPD